ncbi:MAG: DUF4810 domain-containing protein [Treponema sp.]|nr:DUF4810 domain-containing protein [Candidatus Treponema equifaecale]
MKLSLKKLAFVFSAGLIFTSCGSTKLYSWYDYQEDYYHFVKNADSASMKELVKTYDKMIERQNGIRGVVPPGIYADYGYLLLESGKNAEAKAMFKKEIELYPESEAFVGALLKRAEQ